MPMAGCHKPRGKYIVTGGIKVITVDMKCAEELAKYIPLLTAYDKGRLAGIGEGLAMAFEAKEKKKEEK